MASLVEMQQQLVGYESVSKVSDRTKSNLQYAGALGAGAYGTAAAINSVKNLKNPEKYMMRGNLPGYPAEKRAKLHRAGAGIALGMSAASLGGAAYLAHRGNVNRKKAKEKKQALKALAKSVQKPDEPQKPQMPQQPLPAKPVNYTKISEVPSPELANIRRRKANPGLRRQDNQMLDAFVNQR